MMDRRGAEELIADEAERHGRLTACAIAAMVTTRLSTVAACRARDRGLARRRLPSTDNLLGDAGAWLDGATL